MSPLYSKWWFHGAVKLAVLVNLLVILGGCVSTRYAVIPSDKATRYLEVGEVYTAPAGGMWLVPPARMVEITRHFEEHRQGLWKRTE